MTHAAKPIFLIGLPACGKSTLGRAVAQRCEGVTFVDLDAEVEKAAGMSVAQIFARFGEKAFRDAETRALEALCSQKNIIVACGGGTPCRLHNMDMMLGCGEVVLLEARRVRLLQRLAQAPPGKRPMFAGADAAAVLDELESKRSAHYRRAHRRFESSLLDTESEIEQTARLFISLYLTQQ